MYLWEIGDWISDRAAELAGTGAGMAAGAAAGAKLAEGTGVVYDPGKGVAGTVVGAIGGAIIGGLLGNRAGSEIDRSRERSKLLAYHPTTIDDEKPKKRKKRSPFAPDFKPTSTVGTYVKKPDGL